MDEQLGAQGVTDTRGQLFRSLLKVEIGEAPSRYS